MKARPTASPRRVAPICSSTPTTRWTGTPGAKRRWRGRGDEDKPIFLSVGLLDLPLVPRHGARVVLGPGDRRAHEPRLRQHQGGSRGAPGPRRDLHGGHPGDDPAGRLAQFALPDPGAAAVLRRHLLPARGSLRPAGIHHGAGLAGGRLEGAPRRRGHPGRGAGRGVAAGAGGARRPGRQAAGSRGAGPLAARSGARLRRHLGRLRLGAQVPDTRPTSSCSWSWPAVSRRRPRCSR